MGPDVQDGSAATGIIGRLPDRFNFLASPTPLCRVKKG